MKIAFCGTQCTGKTTLINAMFKDQRFKKIHNYQPFIGSIRALAKNKGYGISEHANDDTQVAISNLLIEQAGVDNTIHDRTILDCMSYTMYMLDHNQITRKTYDEIYDKFSKHLHDFDVYFYIEPEFKIIPDGVRSVNEEFRTEVDEHYKELVRDVLLVNKCKVVQLTGTVEQRLNQMFEVLKEMM